MNIPKPNRQNLFFLVINKTGGLQFFSQLKEVYREGLDDKGKEQNKISSDSALKASSFFYTVDNLTQTVIPVRTNFKYIFMKNSVEKIERVLDEDFERHNTIDLIITDQYMISCLHTLTGLRFIVISAIQPISTKNLQTMTPQQQMLNQQNFQIEIQKKHNDNLQQMRQIYRLYTDYFSKDPFQSEDQPLNDKKRGAFEKDIRDLLDF